MFLIVNCVNLHGWFRVEEALFIIKEEYEVDPDILNKPIMNSRHNATLIK